MLPYSGATQSHTIIAVATSAVPLSVGPVAVIIPASNTNMELERLGIIVRAVIPMNTAVLRDIMVHPPVAAVAVQHAHHTMASQAAIPPALRPHHRVASRPAHLLVFQMTWAKVTQQQRQNAVQVKNKSRHSAGFFLYIFRQKNTRHFWRVKQWRSV